MNEEVKLSNQEEYRGQIHSINNFSPSVNSSQSSTYFSSDPLPPPSYSTEFTPQTPLPKKSNLLWWIIGILGLIILFLFVAFVFIILNSKSASGLQKDYVKESLKSSQCFVQCPKEKNILYNQKNSESIQEYITEGCGNYCIDNYAKSEKMSVLKNQLEEKNKFNETFQIELININSCIFPLLKKVEPAECDRLFKKYGSPKENSIKLEEYDPLDLKITALVCSPSQTIVEVYWNSKIEMSELTFSIVQEDGKSIVRSINSLKPQEKKTTILDYNKLDIDKPRRISVSAKAKLPQKEILVTSIPAFC